MTTSSPLSLLEHPDLDAVLRCRTARHRVLIGRLLARAGGDAGKAAALPSWNWAGLLFGTGYLLYRKLWLPGLVLLAMEVAASLLPPPLSYAAWIAIALVIALWSEAWLTGRVVHILYHPKFDSACRRQAGGTSWTTAILGMGVGIVATMALKYL
ncbi:DUF2628 domain-containing protein [Novosphingobium sp. BL-52-GroH]|uniref:DUF2628 domain-containing protein n=1 Tax=Novosphingobium sp. BL-52-GroH TaxID=3349877 RepID=UPI00384B12E3